MSTILRTHNPNVSIIVPVYNVEKYLSECIDSILSQSYTNFELILVDDGSTDNSGMVCDDFAKRDHRIKVYNKSNGGVSSARNLGIEKSSGEWIMFVDGDDWLDSDALKNLIESSVGYDIVRGTLYDVFSLEKQLIKKRSYSRPDNKESFQLQILNRSTYLGMCAAIFRKHLFNKLKFDTNISCGEDWLMLWNVVNISDNVNVVEKRCYLYNKTNETSATSLFNQKKLNDTIYACKQIYKKADVKFKSIQSSTICDIRYHFLFLIMSMNCCNNDLRKCYQYVIKNLPRTSLVDILQSRKTIDIKIFLILSLNINIFIFLNKLYKISKVH